MFDIWKGWPFDGAINDNGVPKAGEGIVAGMAIKKEVPSGELIKADGTAGEKAFVCVEDQSSYDVVFSNKMPYIVKNAIILTDQFVSTDVYAFGDNLQVASAADAGKFRKHQGGAAPIVGSYDGFITRDGVSLMKIILAV